MSEALFVSIITAIITNVVATILFFKDVELKETLESKGKKYISKIYIGLGFVVNICIAVWLSFRVTDSGTIFMMKIIAMLSILWPVCLIDLFSFRIPNRFILYGLVVRIVILLLEILFKSSSIKLTLITEAIAVAVLLIASILCSLCIKNSIGYGDIKLFIIMGLLLGLEGIWQAIFLSLIVMFLVSVVLLISRKKTKKDSIPFGPAIAVGTYLSILMSGM